MQTIDEALQKLQKSDFRSHFSLSESDKAYALKTGRERIRSHAQDFIRQRLAPAVPENDGRQTPMRGHPVFRAQHACACCCRGCLEKWYRVPKNRELSRAQQEKIVDLLMAWIDRQMAGTLGWSAEPEPRGIAGNTPGEKEKNADAAPER